MKKFCRLPLFILVIFFTSSLLAQDAQVMRATSWGVLPQALSVPSLEQQLKEGTFIYAEEPETPRPGQPKRRGANKVVPGKGLPKINDELVQYQREAYRHRGRSPILVFDANTSNYTPSDPTGAAGPNHFVGGWNVGFRIFNKSGNPLTPAASLATLFPGNTLGDPIILYDKQADRFIITEFDNSPNGFNVAVSKGPNPVSDGWWVYTTGFQTGTFPDYPKFSIWSDGYYVTANISGSNKTFVLERDKMLLGQTAKFVALPLPGISTSGFYSPQAFNVSDGNMPPPGNGYVVYMQDDAWSGVSVDHLKIWTINVDWNTTSNSTISTAQIIPTTPFIGVFDGGSFSNRPQPAGPQIDVLQATIMNQAQYRRFPTHNSVVFNFVVDTDATSGELAGIRWYELRQYGDGTPWQIYQEGTYISPYNNKDAFSGSMAMDAQGNIGMAYTTVSTQEMIAIYYTGRLANDPQGVMTVDETLIAQSTSNNPSNRLADYVHLTVDPTDDLTFWHIAEYFKSNQRRDVVGVFQIATALANDVGVLSLDSPVSGILSDNEPITITIFNYGINNQSNIPVSYRIDNGAPVNEIISGPVPSGSSAQFTFATTANLSIPGHTYNILISLDLDGDQVPENDTLTRLVRYLPPTDLGVVAVLAPISGSGLTAHEEVTVLVRNFGGLAQSSIDVSYEINGQTVTETMNNIVPAGETLPYTFVTTGDFSAIASHHLKAYTTIAGDFDPTNDTTAVVIVNTMCQPYADCSNGIGFRYFKLESIANPSGCSDGGYSDYTHLSTDLIQSFTYDLVISTGRGDQFFKVWIDFNDDFVFTSDEVMLNNYHAAPGMGPGLYSFNIPLTIPANAALGEHLMRARSSWGTPVPESACEPVPFGETEDYKVNVGLSTGFESLPLHDAELIVRPLGNNHFEFILRPGKATGTMLFNVHNVLGENLVENRVERSGDIYYYMLDMSYAPKGVYFARFGSYDYGKVKRFYVH